MRAFDVAVSCGIIWCAGDQYDAFRLGVVVEHLCEHGHIDIGMNPKDTSKRFVTDLSFMNHFHTYFSCRALFIRGIHCVVASVSVTHVQTELTVREMYDIDLHVGAQLCRCVVRSSLCGVAGAAHVSSLK
jgi:hypothetical protein